MYIVHVCFTVCVDVNGTDNRTQSIKFLTCSILSGSDVSMLVFELQVGPGESLIAWLLTYLYMIYVY